MILLFTLVVAVLLWVVMSVVMDAVENKTGVSTQCRIARRSLLREYRHKRRPGRRPTMLSHLTDEQWQSHMEAFVDYQCSMGKYSNFTGLIPEWLESEGLPPSPLVPQYNSSGHLTGWLNTAVSTGEAA